VFDYKEGDIFWCTADIGWITGHSYAVYGALLNGATSVLFEGVPNYPDASRFWQVIDKYQVSLFYTAPTAIRALLAQGDEYVHNTSRSSLRVLGSVGEPINHEAWNWYYNVVGNNKCPIVDTWWQTETGGHLLSPLPSFKLKPGSAMKPFFGIKPVLINSEGKAIDGKIEGEGKLCIADSWPSQMRGIFGDKERFENTYFKEATGYYFSGDGAKRDKQGDYWITGRVDDVLNVSGHRLGTAEIEDALNKHSKVAESAVVGIPHHIKGEAIYAYILLKNNVDNTQDLCQELTKLVKHNIGSIACPDGYLITDDLPKTRSGKIMRRILRKIADNQFKNLGDVSTLSNPKSVDDLIKAKKRVNNQNNQNLTEAI
jgi:acetyl-CoA synthetase